MRDCSDLINNYHDFVLCCSTDSAGTQEPKKSAMELLFGGFVETRTTPRETNRIEEQMKLVKDQLGYYRHLPVNLNDNPLEWWKGQQGNLSTTSSLARQRLSVAGTSVPSERLFSAAGNLLSAKRNCLKSSNIDMLLFLNKNMSGV